MSKAKLYSSDGKYKSDLDLPLALFAGKINESALHQYVVIYLGNQRQGTSKTKGRSEVSGTNQKPWKQKGTGRARSGTNTSPIWVRGGKAHGAVPRSYSANLNKKQRKVALVSALSAKAGENRVHVFEEISISEAKTKNLVSILKNAELAGSKSLILVSERSDQLLLAARNIPNVKVSRIEDINAYEVLNTQNLIFTQSALSSITELQGASA